MTIDSLTVSFIPCQKKELYGADGLCLKVLQVNAS